MHHVGDFLGYSRDPRDAAARQRFERRPEAVAEVVGSAVVTVIQAVLCVNDSTDARKLRGQHRLNESPPVMTVHHVEAAASEDRDQAKKGDRVVAPRLERTDDFDIPGTDPLSEVAHAPEAHHGRIEAAPAARLSGPPHTAPRRRPAGAAQLRQSSSRH